ncbi:SseB family protein [Austwickia chelonae]|uniref:SseB family protein n=1 Tax=Austwickia chelonae TaxID=100225 RepID=UPI0013C317D7|nr:SseB family protein [Austwickia chelonae]
MTRRLENGGVGAASAMSLSDTHGVPWSGRSLSPSPFAGDEGTADPQLVRALAAVGVAEMAERARAEATAVEILSASRLVVPLLAMPESGSGANVGAMATALLMAPDGTKALPLFTGVDALASWDPRARPVPMTAAQAAEAALSEEGCHTAVVDVADSHGMVLRMSQLWSLALGEAWVPADQDPVVCRAAANAAESVHGVHAVMVVEGWGELPGALRLEVEILPGIVESQVAAALVAIGERLSADPDVRRRIDDLSVKVIRLG